LIKITKKERFELENNYGLIFGKDIYGTQSKKRHYYMTELRKNMNALNTLRKH